MTYRIIHNFDNLTRILCTTNTTITVVGGSSAICKDDEIIIGAVINKIWINSISGNSAYCKISRGSNTIFIADSSCNLDFKGNGFGIALDYGATLKTEFINGEGVVVLELSKILQPPTGNSEILINGILIDRNNNSILTRDGSYIVTGHG